jgi:hypothetical protein
MRTTVTREWGWEPTSFMSVVAHPASLASTRKSSAWHGAAVDTIEQVDRGHF